MRLNYAVISSINSAIHLIKSYNRRFTSYSAMNELIAWRQVRDIILMYHSTTSFYSIGLTVLIALQYRLFAFLGYHQFISSTKYVIGFSLTIPQVSIICILVWWIYSVKGCVLTMEEMIMFIYLFEDSYYWYYWRWSIGYWYLILIPQVVLGIYLLVLLINRNC